MSNSQVQFFARTQRQTHGVNFLLEFENKMLLLMSNSQVQFPTRIYHRTHGVNFLSELDNNMLYLFFFVEA